MKEHLTTTTTTMTRMTATNRRPGRRPPGDHQVTRTSKENTTRPAERVPHDFRKVLADAAPQPKQERSPNAFLKEPVDPRPRPQCCFPMCWRVSGALRCCFPALTGRIQTDAAKPFPRALRFKQGRRASLYPLPGACGYTDP